ncbi:MAG: hypothetical protein CL489_01765 [Acidobacteria bacterium]|nr:hypothetical protein [Acidobacteriota bacterium]
MATDEVNPTGTIPVQDGSVDSAANAILAIEEREEKEEYESPRPVPSKEKVEAESGAEPEDETDDEAEDEDQTETPVYTVKVDGKDVDVTLDELQSGYLKDSDYRKKTSELAEQRRAVEGQTQAIQQQAQQYAQALVGMKNDTEKQLAEYKKIDWDQLRTDDPMLFMQRRDEQRELEKGIDDNHKQQYQMLQQAQAYQTQQFNQNVETGRDKLLALMPDWDDNTSKDVRDYGLGEGFSNEELSMLTDHRSMAMLRKAMMYDKIQRSQPVKKKVKADTPRYVKSGVVKSKGEVGAKKRTDKLKRLRKTGAVDDAASAIFDLLE